VGAGDQAYVVASGTGLEQKAAASRTVPARELAFRSGGDVVVWFENADRGMPHNLVVYDSAEAGRRIFQTDTIISGHRQYRFPAPAPGSYAFRDDTRPGWAGKVAVVDRSQIPSSVRRFPALATIASGAAIDAHVTKPVAQVVLQYLFSLLNVGLGLLLIRLRPQDLAARLLALGMVGTAAVFNFSAHSALEEIPGLAVRLHDDYHLIAGLATSAPCWSSPTAGSCPAGQGHAGSSGRCASATWLPSPPPCTSTAAGCTVIRPGSCCCSACSSRWPG
jgi:hypothetical protein